MRDYIEDLLQEISSLIKENDELRKTIKELEAARE
jgi:thiamine kinase-like enzyme